MDNGLARPPAEGPAPAHGQWEKMLTLTPVIMTVLATLLAGLSSNEMSQAQYYRALAAQYQARSEGQWGFFAAKKDRQVIHDGQARARPIQSRPGKLEPEMLETLLDRLLARLTAAQAQAHALQDLLEARKARVGSGENVLRERARSLSRTTDRLILRAQALKMGLAQDLASPVAHEAFLCLGTARLPEPRPEGEEHGPATEAAARIERARKAVLEHRPDEEVQGLVQRVSDEDLRQALAAADAHAAAFEQASRPVEEFLTKLDRQLHRPDAPTLLLDRVIPLPALSEMAALLHLETAKVEDALADLPTEATEPAAAGQSVIQADAAVTRTAAELNDLYEAARQDFEARRNDREARDNQQAASLYAVRVQKSGLVADTHRRGSQLFFLGMLGAQAAVAIAALALAARQKSLLWGLAASAGIAAVIFSGWVFWSMRVS